MKRIIRIIVKVLIGVVLLCLVLTAISRFMLMDVNHFRQDIIGYIEHQTNATVSIGEMNVNWLGFIPSLNLQRIEFKSDKFSGRVGNLQVGLNLWQSLLHARYQLSDVAASDFSLAINNQSDILSTSSHPLNLRKSASSSSLSQLFFKQFDDFSIHEGNISFYSSSGVKVNVSIDQFHWFNDANQHVASGVINFSNEFGHYGRIQVAMNLQDKNSLLDTGQIYFQADKMNMKPWLSHLLQDKTGLESANFSLASWVNVEHGQISHILLQLKDGIATWHTKQGDKHEVSFDNQLLSFKQQSDGWLLTLPDLKATTDNSPWPDGQLKVKWLMDKPSLMQLQDSRELRVRGQNISLGHMVPILSLFSFIYDSKLQQWLDLSPSGELSTVALDVPLQHIEQSKFHIKWQDVSWKRSAQIVGLDHFSGQMRGSLKAGQLQVNLVNSQLDYAGVLLAPLDISMLHGSFNWHNSEQGLVVNSNDIQIRSTGLWLTGQMAFRHLKGDEPKLNLVVGANLDDLKQAWRYYPHHVMSEGLINYLTEMIKAGQAHNASIIFSGDPSHFPFQQHDGVFSASIPLKHGIVRYHPAWPEIGNLDADIDLVNDGLTIRAKQAQLWHDNVVANNIVAKIEHYSQDCLTVDAHVKGIGSEVKDYFYHSPLQDSVAKTLENFAVTGDIQSQFSLSIPLSDSAHKTTLAKGKVYFNDNNVTVLPVNMPLAHVNGFFEFKNDEIQSSRMTATLLDQSLNFNFSVQPKMTNQHVVKVNVNGKWSLDTLAPLTEEAKRKISGEVDWQNQLTILVDKEKGLHYQADLTGEFKDVQSQLPEPLAQLTPATTPFNLQAEGDEHRVQVSGILGQNSFNSMLVMMPANTRLSSLVIRANSDTIPTLPNEGIYDIQLGRVDVDSWLKEWKSFFKFQSAGKSIQTLPKQVLLSVSDLTALSQHWHRLKVQYDAKSAQTQSQQVTLKGDEVNAHILISRNHPWQINMDYLYWNPALPKTSWGAIGDNQQNGLLAHQTAPLISDFNMVPSLALTCHECWLMGYRIDNIFAVLDSTPQRLSLTKLDVKTEVGTLTMDGEWSINKGKSHTQINLALSGSDLNKTNHYLGLNSPLSAKSYHGNFALNWQGVPWQPELATVNGELSGRVGKGVINSIDTGNAEKLLRFFSFDALIRKLRFDFNDTFQQGFFFNAIKVKSHATNGLLTLDQMHIDGLSADVNIAGSLNLADQRLNMVAEVSPEISAGVGVATAFAVNPLVGMAAFVGSKVFTPLWSNIFMIKYAISGTVWDPLVDQKEVKQHSHNDEQKKQAE